MKVTFEKILVAICLTVLSLASCIVGLYLLFKTSMEFKYHIAAIFIFIGALLFSLISVRMMFKRPQKKKPKHGADEAAEKEKKPHSLFGKNEEEAVPADGGAFASSEEPGAQMNFDPDTGEALHDAPEVKDAELPDDASV